MGLPELWHRLQPDGNALLPDVRDSLGGAEVLPETRIEGATVMRALAAEYVRWMVLWIGLFVLFYGGAVFLEAVV